MHPTVCLVSGYRMSEAVYFFQVPYVWLHNRDILFGFVIANIPSAARLLHFISKLILSVSLSRQIREGENSECEQNICKKSKGVSLSQLQLDSVISKTALREMREWFLYCCSSMRLKTCQRLWFRKCHDPFLVGWGIYLHLKSSGILYVCGSLLRWSSLIPFLKSELYKNWYVII